MCIAEISHSIQNNSHSNQDSAIYPSLIILLYQFSSFMPDDANYF